MAHFAQLDENNMVLQVIVVANAVITDEKGVESESAGIEFCKQLFGDDTQWIQASYNKKFRGRFPAIGDTYDPVNDVFLYPAPHPTWVLDDEWNWKPPIDRPDDGKIYYWDEGDSEWKETTREE